MATSRTLVVLHGGPFPFQSVQDFCQSHGVAPENADITTEPAALAGGGASYSKAVVLCSQADPAVLGAVSKRLAPGSTVAVQLHKEQVRRVAVQLLLLSTHPSSALSCTASEPRGV